MKNRQEIRSLIVSPDQSTIIAPCSPNASRLTFSTHIEQEIFDDNNQRFQRMHTELEQIKNIPPAAFRRHLGRIGTSEAYLMQLYKEQEPYERDLISVHHSVAEVVVNPSHYNPDDMEILDRFVHLAMRDTGYGDQLILR